MNKLVGGTKLICIKSYFDGFNTRFAEGKEYLVSYRNPHMAKLVYVNKTENMHGWDVSFTEEDFVKHFITMAEWRERQINSILEDE
jgi:hypothetical protein